MSFDGVAIDSVGFDFLTSEWPYVPDIANADNYLRESALANKPPSKTFYDPERDGVRCPSLGVYEHWNDGTDKKYSRNLEKTNGIELFQAEVELMLPACGVSQSFLSEYTGLPYQDNRYQGGAQKIPGRVL
jgi:hypothetical protein